MTTTFESLGLPGSLTGALSRAGFTEPFPIQANAIPAGLAGSDIKGRAPTGSGKTLAFGLPMLTRVGRAERRRPRALVLVPTRELAEQIRRDLAPMADAVDRRITAIYGGVGYGPQKKALDRGVDVLVATPGRLEDLIEQRSIDLSQVDIAVLDEADRMADMGFIPAVRRILDQTKRKRQTLLFSATLDGDVAAVSRQYQNDPVTVVEEASGDQELDVAHHFWRVGRGDRVDHTARVIEASGRTIVFTRTRHGADRLVKQLGRSDIPAVAMHGGRSQSQRTRALKAFSDGTARALVATDVAARGIHVESVDVVLHYDLAADPKDYVHRSGRTARAGAAGVVITLVADGQDKDVKKIQRAINLDVPIGAPRVDLLDTGARRPAVSKPRDGGSRDGGSRDGGTDRPEGRRRRHRSPGRGALSIFVGNLPWRTTEADLESVFGQHGNVEKATIAMQNNSRRSKGYGFVEMSAEEAESAIDALNGSELEGRKLKVRVAH